MTSFAVHPFLTGLAVCGGVSLVLFVATWLVGLAVGRFNVVDTTWGLAFAAIAATSFGSSAGHGVPGWRRALVLALTAAWGLRLSSYIGWRSIGKGEDPRYDDLINTGEHRAFRALGIVFVLQAAVAWLISLPVQAASYVRSGWSWLAWVGVAVWAVGVFFEAVGDAQLNRFRSDPANRGQVMDRGLWRYTRHPNYFGDACVWFGLWLVAAQHWIGALTAFSPVLMYWFLSFKTGKPLLEKRMAETKPGYAAYMERTSGFFPLPPSGRAGPPLARAHAGSPPRSRS
jgi:steroid 5-alpha reductase family enzyme